MKLPQDSVVIVSVMPHLSDAAAPHILDLLGVSRAPSPSFRWHGGRLLTVQVGDVRPGALDRVREVPGVSGVVQLEPSRRLYMREEAWTRHAVAISPGVRIGAGHDAVIAGPCSVESRDQIRKIADAVAQSGACALRGGVFKPRSSPYAFGGLGELGLQFLAEAGAETGLPVVTEALEAAHVPIVAQMADVIQIGSRNMSNFPLLFEAGANVQGRPVLLKRGLSATVEEFLEASEFVLLGRVAAGHTGPGLILCERGIRTFAPALRFTLDLACIPVVQQRTALPIIVDPSHAAGERFLVPALSRASLAVGADGLMVEVHDAPDRAWSDGKQSLDLEMFREMMRDIKRYAPPEVTVA